VARDFYGSDTVIVIQATLSTYSRKFKALTSPGRPAHVAKWSAHSAATCSRAWRAQWPRFAPKPKRICL